MVAFVANGLIMMSINRGLRHLGHLTVSFNVQMKHVSFKLLSTFEM